MIERLFGQAESTRGALQEILGAIHNADNAREALEYMQRDRIQKWRQECQKNRDLFEEVIRLAKEKNAEGNRFQNPRTNEVIDMQIPQYYLSAYYGKLTAPSPEFKMWVRKEDPSSADSFIRSKYSIIYVEKLFQPHEPYLITGRTVTTDFSSLGEYAQGVNEITAIQPRAVRDNLSVWKPKEALEGLIAEMPLWEPLP